MLALPPTLTVYILLLAVIHLHVLLPPELDDWIITTFGFVPDDAGARIWTFVTYSLLHANLIHLGVNVLWLLPFGSALAWRFGPFRFFLFMAVTAAAGALAHLVTYADSEMPMIGASASVSGAMAAAIRFAFARGSFLSFGRADGDDGAESAAKVPAWPLSRALSDARVLSFLAAWFGTNIIFGSIGVGAGGAMVAWQAHIGGFLAGLLLFSLFDPVSHAGPDAADASSGQFSDRL